MTMPKMTMTQISQSSQFDINTRRVLKSIKTLPSEVITLICSFGYPEYKEHMKEICYEINNYTGTGLLEYNLHLLEEDYIHLYEKN